MGPMMMALIVNVGGTKLILDCAANCEACTSGTVTACIKCTSGYFAHPTTHVCVATCPTVITEIQQPALVSYAILPARLVFPPRQTVNHALLNTTALVAPSPALVRIVILRAMSALQLATQPVKLVTLTTTQLIRTLPAV